MEITKLFKLVINIIKSPIKTVKGIDIISYDKDAMLRLFSITSSVLMMLVFLLSYKKLFFGLLVIGILAPFIMFLGSSISAFLYFIIFKLLGKEIKASYEQIKTVLYPIFLTLMIIGIFTSLINFILPVGSAFIRQMVNIWTYMMIFFISRYKLKQTVARSIVITLVPLLFAIIIALLTLVNNV